MGHLPPEGRLDLAADRLAEATVKLQRATAHADAAQAALSKAQQEQQEAEQEFQEAKAAARPARLAPRTSDASTAVDQGVLQNMLAQLQHIIQNSSLDGAGNLVANPGHMEAVIGAAFDMTAPVKRPASPRTPGAPLVARGPKSQSGLGVVGAANCTWLGHRGPH